MSGSNQGADGSPRPSRKGRRREFGRVTAAAGDKRCRCRGVLQHLLLDDGESHVKAAQRRPRLRASDDDHVAYLLRREVPREGGIELSHAAPRTNVHELTGDRADRWQGEGRTVRSRAAMAATVRPCQPVPRGVRVLLRTEIHFACHFFRCRSLSSSRSCCFVCFFWCAEGDVASPCGHRCRRRRSLAIGRKGQRTATKGRSLSHAFSVLVVLGVDEHDDDEYLCEDDDDLEEPIRDERVMDATE